MSYNDHETYLNIAIEVSEQARAEGNNPFGAILVDRDGNILMKQTNIEGTTHKCTGHAETQLAEQASTQYTQDFLWNCTLYTTAEPCAMCTGAIYWANIGRIVYAISEERLLELTGSDPKNPTFNLPCRDILEHGQKNITVIGPFPALETKAVQAHIGFWEK